MRLARACLLLFTARAFTPVPSVARRTTILRAEAEEANVGTAVRNIAPWLLFVLVGAAPRSIFRVNFDAIELSLSPPVDSTQSRRYASRTTRGAWPRRATRPARTSCRRGQRHRRSVFIASIASASTAQRPAGSSSGSTSTASTSQRSKMATSSLVRLCIYVPGTFYCNPFFPV